MTQKDVRKLLRDWRLWARDDQLPPDGFWRLTPFASLGGCGGASNGVGTGYDGGMGGLGSGGGGGGGGVTGGSGGRGGDGLVVIVSW